jgi:hypothetical protein
MILSLLIASQQLDQAADVLWLLGLKPWEARLRWESKAIWYAFTQTHIGHTWIERRKRDALSFATGIKSVGFLFNQWRISKLKQRLFFLIPLNSNYFAVNQGLSQTCYLASIADVHWWLYFGERCKMVLGLREQLLLLGGKFAETWPSIEFERLCHHIIVCVH